MATVGDAWGRSWGHHEGWDPPGAPKMSPKSSPPCHLHDPSSSCQELQALGVTWRNQAINKSDTGVTRLSPSRSPARELSPKLTVHEIGLRCCSATLHRGTLQGPTRTHRPSIQKAPGSEEKGLFFFKENFKLTFSPYFLPFGDPGHKPPPWRVAPGQKAVRVAWLQTLRAGVPQHSVGTVFILVPLPGAECSHHS